MFKNFIVIFFSIVFIQAPAQNVSGSWYGVGKVQNCNGNCDNYLSEIIILQKDKNITGEFNYYFRDSLFKNSITGSFDALSREFKINFFPIIYHKSLNTNAGIDCMVNGSFILRESVVESILSGFLTSSNEFKYTCPPIEFKFSKYNHKLENTIEEINVDTNANNNLIENFLGSNDEKMNEEFNKREKVIKNEIKLGSKEIKLEFYDNGQIDDDSIAVYLNNKLVMPITKLQATPIKLTLHLDKSEAISDLSMFALNLGKKPPNTAMLIMYDGNKKYTFFLASDFYKNESIRLIQTKMGNSF